MTSVLDVRLGAQRPRWSHLPPYLSSAGDEAIELAASAGLFLDDWQQWVLRGALGERPDGRWAASTVGLVVPRQNGKNAILEALELAAVFLWGVRLVVHSAHKFDTSQEHFLRLKSLIENCDELLEQMPATRNRGFVEANGKEQIRLANGHRIKFIARSGGSGRGFTGDLIVFDEAYDLSAAAVGAMIPSLSARTMTTETAGVQVWFTSSAPKSNSATLHQICKRGRAADPTDDLFYAEWGNEPGTSLDDLDALAAANPSLNVRIAEEFAMSTERRTLTEEEFGRERFGIPSAPDMGESIFPPGSWAACEDPKSRPSGQARIALDVHPDLDWASVAGAAARADGLQDVVLLDRRRGTAWVVEAVAALCKKHSAAVVLDPRSAAGGMIADLEKAGVEVVAVSGLVYAQSCSAFQRSVVDGLLRHRGQAPLDAAVAGAAVRTVGDAWAWARLSSQVDISPLVAATLAHGVSPAAEPEGFAMVFGGKK